MATALQRHQLVWLENTAWQRVLNPQDTELAWDAQAAECLAHWARHDLPLVVTRQTGKPLTLGLAAPTHWGRRRLVVQVQAAGDVRRTGAFPLAQGITPLLPAAAQGHWHSLCAALAECGAPTRVFGSYGWQAVSGLEQVRETSDLDVLAQVNSAEQADAVARLFDSAPLPAPRLDGELQFSCGAAVAWREWLNWRAGKTTQILVKRTNGAALASSGFWAEAA